MSRAVLNGLAVAGPASVTGRSDAAQLTVTAHSTQTAKLLVVRSSAPADQLWVDGGYYLQGAHPVWGYSLAVKGDATSERSVLFVNSAGTVGYGFYFSGNALRLRNVGGGQDVLEVATSGATLWSKDTSFLEHLRIQTDTGTLTFGASSDVNLYRKDASTLKTDDDAEARSFTSTDGTDAARVTVSSAVTYFQSGPYGASGSRDLIIGGMFGASEYLMLNAAKARVTSGVIKLGAAEDTDLFRSTTNTLATNSLFDASVAGLRTKHQSGVTPTGGNTGEVRVGTDKLWVQDAGTWKSVAVAAGGAPSFASTVKWGTD